MGLEDVCAGRSVPRLADLTKSLVAERILCEQGETIYFMDSTQGGGSSHKRSCLGI